MTRLAVIGPAWPLRGGIAHFTENTVQALLPHAEVTLITFKRQYPGILFPGTTQEDKSESHSSLPSEALVDSINPLSWVLAALRLRAIKPEAVYFMWWHPFFGPAYGVIALLLRMWGIRTIVMAHNVVPHERSFVDRLLAGFGFRWMDHAVLLSGQTLAEMRAYLPEARLTRLFHPAYTFLTGLGEWTREKARRSLDIGEQEKVALFFGYVRKYKGVPDLVEAWWRLNDPRARLIVAGEFYDDREETLALIEKHHLRYRVILADRYIPNEEVGRFFHAADVLVLPYRHASQSGVGTIGLAFELPMVACRVGGIAEMFEVLGTDGQPLRIGHLVEPDSAEALADGIRVALAEPAGTYQSGLRELKEYYSWEHFGRELLAVAKAPKQPM